MTTQKELLCFCGSSAKLGNNSTIYGKVFGHGKVYICSRFPKCRGYVGAHADGRPLGTIVNAETKALRMRVHALIDPLWREARNGRSRSRNRGSVYGWMRRIMDFKERPFHVGELSKAECLVALEMIEKNPYRPSVESKGTNKGERHEEVMGNI